jgi:AcrR family transcriptional regulator
MESDTRLARSRRAGPPAREPRLERQDWIAAAKTVLIKSGIDRVKVLPLSQALNVTTGSFYWHFKDRPALLAALLEDWEEANSRPFHDVMSATADPHAQFDRIVDIWFRETDFDPAYDSAIRDWARNSAEVEAAVRRVDDDRIAVLRAIFLRMGDPETDAEVRARIVYYHQVGYYAMRIRQPSEERARLVPTYIRLLKGENNR